MESLRDISDTARWVAVYRARENERADALFRDPLARRLAGERGEEIARSLKRQDRHEWAFNTRTYVFDELLRDELANGADMVINLAAGLDARPYRLDLPPSLQWIEVDLPPLIAYKEEVLRGRTRGARSLEPSGPPRAFHTSRRNLQTCGHPHGRVVDLPAAR